MTIPRRLVVTGPESTGKTTLAEGLASQLSVSWVPEQARAYANRVGRPLTSEDVGPIASAQIAAEETALNAAIQRGDSWLVLDTDLVSTVVYARHYYGACPSWIEAEARVRRGDLYLLADIDLPWHADGIRDRPANRAAMRRFFEQALIEFGCPTCPVSGLGAERLRQARLCLASIKDEERRDAG